MWVLLILATVASWALGDSHAPSHQLASVVVIGVAFVKVRFVGRYFMELRDAPQAMGVVLDGYCVLAFVALSGLYAWA